MTSWADLNIIRDILTNYYFGSQEAMYGGILVLVILSLAVAGIEFKYSVVLALPLAGAFFLAGMFGSQTWVFPVILLFVAFLYTYAIIDIFT